LKCLGDRLEEIRVLWQKVFPVVSNRCDQGPQPLTELVLIVHQLKSLFSNGARGGAHEKPRMIVPEFAAARKRAQLSFAPSSRDSSPVSDRVILDIENH
jgi:hypothetical protein